MANFTPGPWHLCQHLKSMECDAGCSCGYRGVIYGPEHDIAYAICQPGHERPHREEEWGSEPSRYPREVELANARAISAVPELIEALQGLLTFAEAAETKMLVGDEGCLWPVEFARAALAKAIGE